MKDRNTRQRTGERKSRDGPEGQTESALEF
jgi:hypothetical protein